MCGSPRACPPVLRNLAVAQACEKMRGVQGVWLYVPAHLLCDLAVGQARIYGREADDLVHEDAKRVHVVRVVGVGVALKHLRRRVCHGAREGAAPQLLREIHRLHTGVHTYIHECFACSLANLLSLFACLLAVVDACPAVPGLWMEALQARPALVSRKGLQRFAAGAAAHHLYLATMHPPSPE